MIFDLGLIKSQEKRKMLPFIDSYSDENLKIARIAQWKPQGSDDLWKATYLMFVKDRGKVDFDKHHLCIFSVDEAKALMEKIGFKVEIFENFSLEKLSDEFRRPTFIGKKKFSGLYF